jgi:glycine C-acetyltransferase
MAPCPEIPLTAVAVAPLSHLLLFHVRPGRVFVAAVLGEVVLKEEVNTRWFRQAMTEAGFAIRPGSHPIVPIMLGDAPFAHRMAADLLDEGIYVVGFSYPVVPMDQARIRVQISAAHEPEHLERAVAAFVKVGRSHGVIR